VPPFDALRTSSSGKGRELRAENSPVPKGRALVPIAAILLLAFALRLYRLGDQSIWYDEGISIHLAQKSLAALMAHTAGDIHPPLYYCLLHFWIKAAGSSEFAVAFLSLGFGLLLVPLVYCISRHLYNPMVGSLAAFLVAISPYNLWYSQEMRMYTLGASLGLVSLYSLLQLLARAGCRVQDTGWSMRNGERRVYWAGYILSAALGLYTLYYFAFLLAFLNLFVMGWWLWTRRQGGRASMLWHWVLVQLAVLILYLPWLPVAWRQATDPPVPPWRAFTPFWQVVVESWSALALGQSVEPRIVWPVLLMMAIIYGLGAVYAGPGFKAQGTALRLTRACVLWGYTFVPVLIVCLVSLWAPLFHVRYVFTYSPAFYILLAAGLAWLRGRWRLGLWLVLSPIVVASAYSIYNLHFDPRYAADDHRTAVEYIADRWRPGDAILINAGYVYPTFLYYYHGPIAWRGRLVDYEGKGDDQAGPSTTLRAGPVVLQTGSIGGAANLGWGNPQSDFYPTTEAETTQALERVFSRHPRLWVFRAYDTVTDPDGFIRLWLDEHGRKFDELLVTGESGIRVQGYLTHREPAYELPPFEQSLNVSLGGQITLLGYEKNLASVTAGEPFDLTVYWQPEEQLSVDYHLFYGLFDGQGRLWAQGDETPIGPLYRPSHWVAGEVVRHPIRLTVPVGTPPGEYAFQVGMYNPRTGQWLEVEDQSLAVRGVWVGLGVVQVMRPSAWPEMPAMQHRVGVRFSDPIELLGYNLPVLTTVPGGTVPLDLFWRSRGDSLEDYVIFTQLVGEEGQVLATQESAPVDGGYSTTLWARGEIVRDQRELVVAANVSGGKYRLVVGLYHTTSRERLRVELWPFSAGQLFTLGTITVQGRPVTFERPQGIQYPMEARLGEHVALIGYGLSAESVLPGSTLTLTLYWQALGPMSQSYKVFTHLVGPDGEIGGQRDSLPGEGSLPTSGWIEGEYLVDSYPILVKPEAPGGEYLIEIGMYEESTGARLPAFDAQGQAIGDKIVLGRVRVP
jgi:4-amino-4-deoxy-L-arabinose transferase-like glycosyltransferase